MKEIIKERIENKSLTQKELAEIADISETHLSLILKGDRHLSYSLATRIYKELGYRSPLSLILEYYGFEAKGDDVFGKLTEYRPITKTIYKVITTHFKNNDLSRKEKVSFLNNMIIVCGTFVDTNEDLNIDDIDKDKNNLQGRWLNNEPYSKGKGGNRTN